MFDSLPALGPELNSFSASQTDIRGAVSVDRYRQVWWCSKGRVCTLRVQIQVPVFRSLDSEVFLLTDSGFRSIQFSEGVLDTGFSIFPRTEGVTKVGIVYPSLAASLLQAGNEKRGFEEFEGHLEVVQSGVMLKREKVLFPDSISSYKKVDHELSVGESSEYLRFENGGLFTQNVAIYRSDSRLVFRCPARSDCWILQNRLGNLSDLVVQTDDAISPCGVFSCKLWSPRFFKRKVS